MEITEIPFGYVQDNLIYLKGESEGEGRQIGEVKEDNLDASVQYFVDKFKRLEEKIDDLENKINESDNKGSFLMKLLHMKNTLDEHCGLGDYATQKERLGKLETILNEVIEKNREKNTEIKRSLLAELEEALEITNWRDATDQVLDIKTRWIKTGSVKEDKKEEIEDTFQDKVDDFFDRKRAFEADQRLLTDNRIKKYRDILWKAKQVLRSGDRNAKNQIKELQGKWRDVGNIPKMKYFPLQKDFKRICDDVFRAKPQRQRIVRQIPNYQLNENLEKKQRLLERAKLLKQDPSLDKANELKEKWKAVGPVPKEKNKELNDAFFDCISFVHEVIYLDRVAAERNEGWDSVPIMEQMKMKIEILSELLEKR